MRANRMCKATSLYLLCTANLAAVAELNGFYCSTKKRTRQATLTSYSLLQFQQQWQRLAQLLPERGMCQPVCALYLPCTLECAASTDVDIPFVVNMLHGAYTHAHHLVYKHWQRNRQLCSARFGQHDSNAYRCQAAAYEACSTVLSRLAQCSAATLHCAVCTLGQLTSTTPSNTAMNA